jgi:hypothetical protein
MEEGNPVPLQGFGEDALGLRGFVFQEVLPHFLGVAPLGGREAEPVGRVLTHTLKAWTLRRSSQLTSSGCERH